MTVDPKVSIVIPANSSLIPSRTPTASGPENGKPVNRSTPRITVPVGEEGRFTVGDEKEMNGVFCTVLVEENANRLETLKTIIVKENGETMLNTPQKTLVEK